MNCKVSAHFINRACFRFLLILFVMLSNTPVFSQAELLGDRNKLSSNKKQKTSSAQIETYVHPIRKFTASIPVDAELIEREKSRQVSIRSRLGYIINIQSGDSNPSLSLLQMIAKLETKYLGQGKPWSHKHGEKISTMSGLNAIEAIYDGAGTRAKVVIARGIKTDFVIIFLAPVESFEKLEREFKWFLSNFRPNSIELTAVKKKLKENHKKFPISLPLLISFKLFTSSGQGFSIQYPENWIAIKSLNNTIASFNGKKGTLANKIVVSIQNVRPPEANSSSEVVEQALTDLKSSLAKKTDDFKVIEDVTRVFNLGNLNFFGRHIVVTYSYLGNRYRRWSILIPRPDDTIAHIWSYTAPELHFFDFHPLADTMLKSWVIQSDSN